MYRSEPIGIASIGMRLCSGHRTKLSKTGTFKKNPLQYGEIDPSPGHHRVDTFSKADALDYSDYEPKLTKAATGEEQQPQQQQPSQSPVAKFLVAPVAVLEEKKLMPEVCAPLLTRCMWPGSLNFVCSVIDESELDVGCQE